MRLPRRKELVLFVESERDHREMYALYLRSCGFRVETAATTDEGLGLARAATVDVVVTGIRVAGSVDGIELVRRLRAANETRQTPIIVLTACVFQPDEQRARAAGCDVFLPKPCLPERLADEIRTILARTLRGSRNPAPLARTSTIVAHPNTEHA